MTTQAQPSEPTPGAAAAKVAQAAKVFVAIAALIVAGFFIWRQLKPKPFYEFNPATFAFNDHAQSNVGLDGCDVESLEFVNLDGQPADLKQFLGQKNVVLVVTRGNTSGDTSGTRPDAYYGNICLYCRHANLATDRQLSVVPGSRRRSRGRLSDPATRRPRRGQPIRRSHAPHGATAKPPFPLVLDVELRAVDQLGIRADLSKPATYIVDKEGQVRFAYVGATIADRPSVKSMLEQLAAINADAK